MAKSGRSVASSKSQSKRAAVQESSVPVVAGDISEGDKNLVNVFKVTDLTSDEDIIRYGELPGVVLEFDYVKFRKLSDEFVAMLPASSQKNYWIAFSEWDSRRKLADRAVYETPNAVDPMSKLLDGPRGTANPLVRDKEIIDKKIGGEYYVTWRLEGGQGDLEAAERVGFKVMRHPKDKEEEKTKSPLDWSGERWAIRDGTVDPTSGDEIYNVMVCIRQQAWTDNLQAMSLISHNAYSTNKKQFFEGADNISRDMLSSKERIQVSDLDELHVEEHTIVQNGRRVAVKP